MNGVAARFARRPLAVVSLGYLLLVVAVTLFAGRIAPYPPDRQDLGAALTGPSRAHLLGAGELGRDVLSRMIYGGRATLLAVLVTMVVFTLAGVPAGILAGYRGGRFDRFVLTSADLMFAIPVMIVLLVVLAIFPNNEVAAMAVSGLLGAPGLARVVRSATLGVREELYVRAAVASGLRDTVILRRHVLPRVTGTILVQVSMFGAGAVLLETGLGFLGLGTTAASWGNLVGEASRNLGTLPWLLIPSGVLIITVILAINLVGDGLRDALAERQNGVTTGTRRPARTPPAASTPDDTPPAPDALLEVRDLTVTLPIDGVPTEVIGGVSFDLRPGEALGIVGESGCGKTVTASALLGLLPPGAAITRGGVRFRDTDLTRASAAQARRIRGGAIGWISQDPIAGLDPSFTAGAQVAEAVRLHTGCGRREARRKALDLLERVRLTDPPRVYRSYPHQLSGGMAQRVGIAAALAGDPALLIADEPTTALDVTVQAEILDLLRELRRAGTAIVLITHDWGVLADLCDTAVVMYAGQVVERAPVAAMVAAPVHPYTGALLRSDPHHAVRGEPLPVLAGAVPAPADRPTGCHFQNRCPRVTDGCRDRPIAIRPLPEGDRTARCARIGAI
ncbi:dipeptide/oligopeptide/nickel ABC transporter permease/ATP-binding protein [Actinoplanes sp. NPDC051851]|uniref:dipeptide/oligopeptide/nickel ABC transporter permease/ATP-binding protein n=1 Tax=Actinoplanes sp. NPDC051851 TaxID=3154753 RepID=UPI0034213BB3